MTFPSDRDFLSIPNTSGLKFPCFTESFLLWHPEKYKGNLALYHSHVSKWEQMQRSLQQAKVKANVKIFPCLFPAIQSFIFDTFSTAQRGIFWHLPTAQLLKHHSLERGWARAQLCDPSWTTRSGSSRLGVNWRGRHMWWKWGLPGAPGLGGDT